MALYLMDGVLFRGRVFGGDSMSVHKRTATLVMARRLRMYRPGEKVRVLRGKHADQVMTVREATNDYVCFEELPKRECMSKGNVEPADGFTSEEMVQAERIARKGG